VQDLNEAEKYIVGTYTVEVLTLPRLYYTVQVNQSSTTNIEFEAPGLFTYKCNNPTIGQVFVLNTQGKWDWVCSLDGQALNGQWNLQPGQYKISYRMKSIKSSMYSYEQDFRIVSNKTTSLNL
jgi:Ca-activated chloride channel family protein